VQPNSDGKFVVEIKNERPVALIDLTDSLSAFAREFEAFADSPSSDLAGAYRSETRLYISSMRTGSIISELIPHAPALLPILSEVNTVVGFAKHIKSAIEVMLAKKKDEKSKVSTPTLQNIKSIIQPVAKDNGSQLMITGDVNVSFNAPVTVVLNSNSARSLEYEIDRELEQRNRPEQNPYKNVVMHWYQARNDAASKAGDRAIIESIWPKSVKVVFESEKAKYKMLKVKDNLFDHAFLVDVQVEMVLNRPTLYKIVAFHRDLGRRELPVRKRPPRRSRG
jgi:hypothetical protein